MSAVMPFEVVRQPGTDRVDYFYVDSNHTPFWSGPASGPLPNNWKPLTPGITPFIKAFGWTPDNSQLIIYGIGQDSKIYTNVYTAASNTWSGWLAPNPDGSFAYAEVALG